MEKKTKLAIIGLVGLLLASLIMSLQISFSKRTLDGQIERLNEANAGLQKQLEEVSSEKRRIEEYIDSLNTKLAEAAAEKDELQRKYDSAEQAKESLLGQMKALESRPETAQRQPEPAISVPPPESLPQRDDAYWGGILRAKADVETQLSDLRAELKNAQLYSEQLQREKKGMEAEIADLSRDRQELKEQIEDNRKIINNLSVELAREKSDKLQLQSRLDARKNENNALAKQVKSLSDRNLSLEGKIAGLKQQNESYEAKLKEMGSALSDYSLPAEENIVTESSVERQSDSGQTGKTIELPPIVVRPSGNTEAVPPPQTEPADAGKIVSVDRENNFVIVDFGRSTDVKNSDNLSVYRDSELIAGIEVIQTRDTIAACDIKKESKPIKIGDIVR